MHDQRPLPLPEVSNMWRTLGTYWWTTEKSSIFGVLGRSLGMLVWLDGKGQGHFESGP
jgi:hypothetical protein